ncbi:hypothetical protein [Acidovorax sp. MR-S7]|uniref:hypothetical protein n=1 Tax=Acidovorax sp. MR-S7 TaxID=1268622 RepID=UPI0003A4899A|nr:hypothetical protein [Acidovorax sp. MR-S7]GAD20906.1 hypothetical protein AVS7_00667 [Acidovorax sp. MR-S7]
MTTNTNAALAQLRHLYANMMGGEVRDTAQTKRMAQGLLAPAIEALEQAALTTAAAVPAVRHIPVTDSIGTTQAAFENGWNACVDAQLAAAPKAEPVTAKEPTAWAVYDIKNCGSKSLHWNDQHESNGDSTRWSAVPLYEPSEAQAAPAALDVENRSLRRMLCVAHAGALAYMDDGEAQDCREMPWIDFLRDSPAEIQDKLHRRALKQLAAPAAVTRIQQPYTLAEIKAKIASNDYSAELLLQHAMLLLEKPAAVAGPREAVAYLDIGGGGYFDLGSDLSDEALRKLPKGRNMLAIVGTYGVDGYVPVATPTSAMWKAWQAARAQPTPPAADQEPFGYFRAEPFGWTDCAETDEGAVALYEHPTPPAVVESLTDGLLQQHNRDSQELRRLCAARDQARSERDALKAEIAVLESSCATLGRLVDELRPDAERLEWVLRRCAGPWLRAYLGIVSDTSDMDTLRTLIDANRGALIAHGIGIKKGAQDGTL